MKQTIKKVILPLLFTAPFSLFAQPAPGSEAYVQLQEVFIDGNREKLLGNWDKAALKFQEVLEKDPKNAAAAYELARVQEAMKDLEKATTSAKKAVDLEPTNPWFQMYLASLYQKTNSDREAAAVYEVLVKQDPRNEEYYFKWAYYLVRAADPVKAIKVYDDLEKIIGINEETTRHKQTLYMGMGDYKKASKELDELIAVFPDNTAYLHLLATFYDQTGEKVKSKDVYKKILTLDANDARAQIALSEDDKGNDDIKFLNGLKPIFENPAVEIDTKIREILPYVNHFADTGDQQLGTTLLGLTSILERVHPNSAKATSVVGDVLYYMGDKDKALEKYKKTLELDDTVWLVWEQLLYIYDEKGDYATLVKTSEKALDIFPNQASAHYFNGVGYNETGKYKEALGALQQALLMSAKNPGFRYEVLNETGKAYFNLKQYPQSDNAFEEALKLNGNDPLVLRNYSHCLAARAENLDKAKDMALHLNDIAPGHPLHENALAFVFYKMKDYKSAKEWLDKALQDDGNNFPEVLEQYGDLQYQLGNHSEAVLYWQKAMEKGGKSALLERKVAEGKLVE